MKLTLAPHEVRILRFGAQKKKPAQIRTAKTISDRAVCLCFDQRVSIADALVLLNGAQAELTLCADYHTVLASCKDVFLPYEAVAAEISLVDCAGNAVQETARIPYYPDDVIVRVQAQSGAYLADSGVEGEGDFTVTFPLATQEADVMLLTQDGAFTISVDADGKLRFSAGGVTALSTQAVNDGKERRFAALREKNGMLKIYVDGKLDASAYCAAHVNESLRSGPVTAQKLPGGEVCIFNRALAFDEFAK